MSKTAFDILVPHEQCKIFVFGAKYSFTYLPASDFKVLNKLIFLLSVFS